MTTAASRDMLRELKASVSHGIVERNLCLSGPRATQSYVYQSVYQSFRCLITMERVGVAL